MIAEDGIAISISIAVELANMAFPSTGGEGTAEDGLVVTWMLKTLASCRKATYPEICGTLQEI